MNFGRVGARHTDAPSTRRRQCATERSFLPTRRLVANQPRLPVRACEPALLTRNVDGGGGAGATRRAAGLTSDTTKGEWGVSN